MKKTQIIPYSSLMCCNNYSVINTVVKSTKKQVYIEFIPECLLNLLDSLDKTNI